MPLPAAAAGRGRAESRLPSREPVRGGATPHTWDLELGWTCAAPAAPRGGRVEGRTVGTRDFL